MVHAPLLLVTGYLYCTRLSSTGPLNISMVHYLLLLAHWLSLWYTPIFYRPTGCLCGTLPSLIRPPIIPMIHCYLLLATGFYHLLAHWQSLCNTAIFYWPSAYFYGKLPFFYWPTGYPHATVLFFCWATGYLYGTLSSPIGPLAISKVHVPFLLGHWLSLWYTTIFYRPTCYPYGTLPSPISQLTIPMIHYKFTGPLGISMVHYPLLLAHWISLWYTIIFY